MSAVEATLDQMAQQQAAFQAEMQRQHREFLAQDQALQQRQAANAVAIARLESAISSMNQEFLAWSQEFQNLLRSLAQRVAANVQAISAMVRDRD